LFDKLRDLNARLDRSALRVRQPHQIIFLCGGLIAKSDDKSLLSVRDYLHRVRPIEKKVGAAIVLAEVAQQLYRDTTYSDLISFEEDIAKISSVVLVISESPGSLAELGSFSSERIIRQALLVIICEDQSRAESFVRYGPIRRLENGSRSNLGVFPWKTHKSTGFVVKSSISPHYNEIVTFIRGHVSAVPGSFSYSLVPEKAIFFDIVWLLSLLDTIPPEPLYEAVRLMYPAMADSDIKNHLYVLRVCRWIDVFSYSGRDYYFLPENRDPFDYAFLPGRRVRDVAALKLEIITSFRRDAAISKAVVKRLSEKRKRA